MTRTRRSFLAALLIGAMTFTSAARAEYPDHSIQSVIPFAPGGSSDLLGRLFSQALSEALGQNLIIANKPGAAANVGMGLVAHSKPDGYTILFTGPAATQNPALYQEMPYDPLKDLVPVALLAEGPFMITVNTDKIKAQTVAELVDLLRKNPGKYNAAAGGIVTRLSIEVFRRQNNLDVAVIPYSSAGVAAASMLTGETDLMIVDPAPLAGGIASGKIKALAITSAKRDPNYPNVPTTAEAGFANFKEGVQFGAYMPSATPAPILQKLHDTLTRITTDPAIVKQAAALGFDTVQMGQAETNAWYKAEILKWKDIVKAAGIPYMD